MKIEYGFFRYAMYCFIILLSSCNWFGEKKEQAKKKITQEMEEHVLVPVAEGIFESVDEVFNPPNDSAAAMQYCEELRPYPLKLVSKQNLPKVGYQYKVLASTSDADLSHIDASFFEPTDKFYPIQFPFYLDYSGETLDYFHLDMGYYKYSDLPQIGAIYFKEIYQLAIYDHYLMMATYDDDLSFMSSTKDGVNYFIFNLDTYDYFDFTNQNEFEKARKKLTNSDAPLKSNAEFIQWYKTYKSPIQ